MDPRTLLWVTPALIGVSSEVALPYWIEKDWYKLAGKFLRNFSRNPRCHTLWNAKLTSKNIAGANSLFSKAYLAALTIWWTCSMVECLLRTPNWKGGSKLYSWIIGCSQFKTIFSKILASMGRREMGLYELGFSRGLPTLSKTIISAICYSFGTYTV